LKFESIQKEPDESQTIAIQFSKELLLFKSNLVYSIFISQLSVKTKNQHFNLAFIIHGFITSLKANLFSENCHKK
jgi:hypothetical protein